LRHGAGEPEREAGVAKNVAGAIGIADDPAYLRGVILVLLAGCALSSGGLIIRLMEAAGGWQILFWRSAAMVPALLLVIAIRRRGRLPEAFTAAGWNGLVGGLCAAFGFTGFVFAVLHTSVANVLFILSAAPFLTALLAWLVLGEAVRRRTWWGMGLALCGVAVMVGDGLTGRGLTGDLIALLATAGFAGFSVALRRGRDVDMLPTVVLAGLFSILLAAVASGGELWLSPRDLVLCLILGLVQLTLGLTLFTLGSRHVPAAELTLLSMTEVVLGPIWVWLAVGEVPSPLTLAGGALVLGAVAYQALGGVRRKRPPIART
jgi:drug/metabolite transporter, DME family